MENNNEYNFHVYYDVEKRPDVIVERYMVQIFSMIIILLGVRP